MSDTTTPAQLLATAEAALRDARHVWLMSLPEFPADGVCPNCGQDGSEFGAWQHQETGYSRWTNGKIRRPDEDENFAPYLHLSTDGWDDMSATGDIEWVECNRYNTPAGCGAEYRMPDNVEWD